MILYVIIGIVYHLGSERVSDAPRDRGRADELVAKTWGGRQAPVNRSFLYATPTIVYKNLDSASPGDRVGQRR